MQAAIWDRRGLAGLLKNGESIWDFEHNVNLRAAAQSHGFYSVWRPVLPYEGLFAHHVVEKNRWLPHEKWIFARAYIGCDFTRRATLSWPEALLCQLARTMDRSLAWLPWRTKRQVKQRLRAMLEPCFRERLQKMGGLHKPPP
jgi:hypothetical protein